MSSRSECKHKSGRGGKHGSGAAASMKVYAPIGWLTYLVMDYVAGRSLHEWLYLGKIEGQLPWPIIWSTIDQALGALAHSHARGVIHGDLKPSNIIVDLHGECEEPSVYVLDLK